MLDHLNLKQDYFLYLLPDTLHEIFYDNTEIMIIGSLHNLKYYITYKIVLLLDFTLIIKDLYLFNLF